MIERKAEARWEGDLKGGKGKVELGSGAFAGAYSFGTRFENAKGANPEELLGAAHAACFSMALANALAQAGHVATQVHTTAKVRADKVDGGFAIVGIALETTGKVPGIDAATFKRYAEETKTGCIVSKALASVPMTLTATLA